MKKLLMTFSLIILMNVNLYSQWIQTSTIPIGGGITDMITLPNGYIVVTCGNFNFPTGPMGGVRTSTDKGSTWLNGLNLYTARTVARGQNGNVFFSGWNYPTTTEGLYKSNDNGVNWSSMIYTVGAGNNIFSILPMNNDQTIYIGTRTGVLKSTNGGFNFSSSSTGMPSNSWVFDLALDDTNNVLAAATSNGLFISTNNGGAWTEPTGFSNTDTNTACLFGRTPSGRNLYAGTRNGKLGVFPSTSLYDSASAIVTINPNLSVEDLDSAFWSTSLRKILAAGTPRDLSQSGGGVYSSSDEGLYWYPINDGFPSDPFVSSIALDTNDIFAGTYKNTSLGAEVFFRPLNSVGIQQISSEIPSGFSLSQNYPNPFNPETKIKFTVPANAKEKNIHLAVYNVMGQQVALLVNESLETGVYEYTFNASDLSSGIYFYTLNAGNYKETKRMMLIK